MRNTLYPVLSLPPARMLLLRRSRRALNMDLLACVIVFTLYYKTLSSMIWCCAIPETLLKVITCLRNRRVPLLCEYLK